MTTRKAGMSPVLGMPYGGKQSLVMATLAAMSDDWNDYTARLMDTCIAMVAVDKGCTEFTITPNGMAVFMETHIVTREVTSDGSWTVKVQRKSDPNQKDIPL